MVYSQVLKSNANHSTVTYPFELQKTQLNIENINFIPCSIKHMKHVLQNNVVKNVVLTLALTNCKSAGGLPTLD